MPDTKRTATGVLGGLAGLVGLSAVAGLLVTVTVTPAIAVSGYAASSAITMFDNLPSVLEIDELMEPTTLLYKDPNTGQDVEWTSFFDQNRSPVTFDQVAPVMYDAILSSEDPRFYDHGGIDLIGTTRAALSNLEGGTVQGGSSISQQYVKNVLVQQCYSTATNNDALLKCYNDATESEDDEGIQRKLQEMRYAIALEQQYSKNDILLGYLNIANFGGINYGVDAASRYYFNVPASNLTLAQSATLAGMVQNPNTYRIDQPASESNGAANGVVEASDRTLAGLVTLRDNGTITAEQFTAAADPYGATKGRQLYVLSRLLADGKITQEQYVQAAIEPIAPSIHQPTTGCASTGASAYFCQYVVSVIKKDTAFGATDEERLKALRRGGLRIYTTLDPRVQATAEQATAQYAPSSVANMRFGSTTVSLEAPTGRVLAIAQNTKFSEAAANAQDPNYSSLVFAGDSTFGNSDGFNAGSTFKLFTLVDWLEKGHSVNETLNGRLRVFKKITNSCDGDWYNTSNTLVNNFGRAPGYTGTPMSFTRDSLNTGFFAMAEKLDLCDIKNVATKMGVTLAKGGGEVQMTNLSSVIGTNAVSPLAMAGAYATIANNGIYCQPTVIDKVTDKSGTELEKPKRSCTQVVDPNVAAAAAFALQGVMRSGGTGSQANPGDGTPVLGKTGTHEQLQTWMIESSTKVATATWAGVIEGQGNMQRTYYNRNALSNIRYPIARAVQQTADAIYGGDAFPQPQPTYTKTVLTDLPNVVGQTVDQATATLENAGFSVSVGAPVDSNQAEGLVATQNPGAGRAPGGATVTINPSNGQGVAVPAVSGQKLSDALATLTSAGFGSVQPGTCTQSESADAQGTASDTNPAAGSIVNRGTAITVNYSAKRCG